VGTEVATPGRLLAAELISGAALLVSLLLAAAACTQEQSRGEELVFPVRGECSIVSRFGEARPGNRRHMGIDIAAGKMTPVVAAAPGAVEWLHSTPGEQCCAVALVHDNGWHTRYLHLNDDTPGTDDGRVVGIVKGLQVGDRVRAGQLIGWVGDSGNATAPHLHFELQQPDGTPVDPYQSLRAAARRDGESLVLAADSAGFRWRLAFTLILVTATLTIRALTRNPLTNRRP
jgi:murein DD-endopeptidase MepM/ murein hydrolase activator NlpD